MQTNTLIGAMIAALILFVSSLVTLFTENPDLTLDAIKQSTWISIVGGAVVAFLKDYQAINTRRVVNKVTGSGDGGGKVQSPPIVGILAAVLALMMLSGCSGTRAAYDAADGLEETAKVMTEHYYATVRELNDLDDAGALSPTVRADAQDLVRKAEPLVEELSDAAQAYEAVRSAETEAELQEAINEAAKVISDLIDAFKGAGRGDAWLRSLPVETLPVAA